MAVRVELRNERTGETKKVKVGWSWTLFFFSSFLGIPLFARKLSIWGGAMLALCILYWVLNYVPMPDDGGSSPSGTDILFFGVSLVLLGFNIFFALKGNEMTGKHLLENGWEFAEPNDRETDYAKMQWSLS